MYNETLLQINLRQLVNNVIKQTATTVSCVSDVNCTTLSVSSILYQRHLENSNPETLKHNITVRE